MLRIKATPGFSNLVMKIKINKLVTSRNTAKAAETDQPKEYISLYRRTTSTRDQEYVKETDTQANTYKQCWSAPHL